MIPSQKIIYQQQVYKNYINIYIFLCLGVDFKCKIINLDSKIIKLKIYDTAGQERFKARNISFTRCCPHGIIIAYDVTNLNSFQNSRYWINRMIGGERSRAYKILVGNKCDKSERIISK